MKMFTLIIFSFFAISLAAQENSGTFNLPENLTLKDISGADYRMDELLKSQTPFILDFWATWCAPCIMKYDSMKGLAANWKDETNVEIIIVSIDTDERLEEVKKMIEEKGWPFKVLLDPGKEVFNSMNEGKEAIPQSFFFNSAGDLKFRKNGITIKMSGDSAGKKTRIDHQDYYDKMKSLQ